MGALKTSHALRGGECSWVSSPAEIQSSQKVHKLQKKNEVYSSKLQRLNKHQKVSSMCEQQIFSSLDSCELSRFPLSKIQAWSIYSTKAFKSNRLHEENF